MNDWIRAAWAGDYALLAAATVAAVVATRWPAWAPAIALALSGAVAVLVTEGVRQTAKHNGLLEEAYALRDAAKRAKAERKET